jgi:uncharacterized membrane protein YkvA (DUF1232 family)
MEIGETTMTFSVKELYQWYRQTVRNPKYRWWIIVGTLAYLFSPLDFAPDLFPIVGQIDDIAVLTLLLSEISQLVIDRVRARQDSRGPEAVDAAATVDVEAVPLQDQG